MEPFDEEQVISELIDLAQTPDQVAWLKNVIPGVTRDKIEGLQDFARSREVESERWRAELRRVNNKLDEAFTPKHVEIIITSLAKNIKGKKADHWND